MRECQEPYTHNGGVANDMKKGQEWVRSLEQLNRRRRKQQTREGIGKALSEMLMR